MSAVLEWQHIDFTYDHRFGLKDINFLLKRGDFTLFFGPNGAGKSTLFKLGVGLLKPNQGRVVLEGRPIAYEKPVDIAKKAAFLEQEIQYLFPFTVEEVVLMGRFPHTADQFWDRKEDLELAVWAMDVTGVLRFAKRSIFHLSSGERRKVEIARALCQKPDVLLLDEPTTFLDVKQQAELFELLSRLNETEGITIGIISHQLGLAKKYLRTAVFLMEGRLIQAGAVGELLTQERVSEFFGLKSPSFSLDV